VLEPETGVYMDDPSCWTLASLYPSSMISVNLSHDTLLPPGDEGQALKRASLETRRWTSSSPMRTV
jgi:DNA polymerase elongation subunit (family B)